MLIALVDNPYYAEAFRQFPCVEETVYLTDYLLVMLGKLKSRLINHVYTISS